MKNILVIGATGQIGSELTLKLREIYGNTHVVCGYIPSAKPRGELRESGPFEICDVTNPEQIATVVLKHHVDTIYNLAALLSVVAEGRPQLAWKIGIDGLGTSLRWLANMSAQSSPPVPSALSVPKHRVTMCHKTPSSAPPPSTAFPR